MLIGQEISNQDYQDQDKFLRLQLVQSVGVPRSKRMLHFQLRKLNMLVVIWELKKLFG